MNLRNGKTIKTNNDSVFLWQRAGVRWGERRKREEKKKEGERNQPRLLFWQRREMQWWGAESCVLCQHIHMSSLFRHTLENVTSFQAWPGKGSTVEGGRAPDCVPESRLPLCACMHMCVHDSLHGHYVCFCMQFFLLNDVSSGTSSTDWIHCFTSEPLGFVTASPPPPWSKTPPLCQRTYSSACS